MIDDLVAFARKLHNYEDLANLRLPGFTWTRQGVWKWCRKLSVRRHQRTSGRGVGVDFFELPDWWQEKIIRHFIGKPQDAQLDQKQIDKIFYAAACIDQRFAEEWARREKHLDAVHKKIINLIVACGVRRDNGF